jgi:methylase of polypeptide subunit release factors
LNKNDENRILKTFVIDISQQALDVSKINIKRHNLENKITQIKSNLLEQLELNTNILCSN